MIKENVIKMIKENVLEPEANGSPSSAPRSDEGRTMTLVDFAREYAVRCHTETNHRYGDMPYAVHLQDVYHWALTYRNLLEADLVEDVLAACWCHDIIEDARQTYNDVRQVIGTRAAEMVYAVTNEKGRTRRDRANDAYYAGIRACLGATFIKLCDRLANVSNANGSMRGMYRKEHQHFVRQLFDPRYQEMFDKLVELLKPVTPPDQNAQTDSTELSETASITPTGPES